jgi:hypothetical protein
VSDGIEVTTTGFAEAKAAIAAMVAREDAATARAMSTASQRLRDMVRANMNGRPGPNRITGRTQQAVHAEITRRTPDGYTATVSAISDEVSPYIGKLEADFPFFAPAADAFDLGPIVTPEWDAEFHL